jgi:1-phosphofructokinase family hexose kinase
MIYTVTLNPAVDRELLIPEIEFDSVLRASESRVDFGGKGFNVSRMLKSLDTASIALGFAGGRSGELLRDGLHSLGIQTDFVWIEGETRTNVSIVSQAQKRYIKANEPGPVISSARQEQLRLKIRSLAQAGDWWVLTGSIPPGVPDTIYAELIELIQGPGARAILDTSGGALACGCQAGPYLVKPNRDEASRLTGLPTGSRVEIIAAAKVILRMGPAHVVISLGNDGALLVQEDQVWAAGSPPIEERNPIGAGDSMIGGLVWGLQQGLAFQETLGWGIACGAATASLSGTTVGSRDLVADLARRVTIEPAGLD